MWLNVPNKIVHLDTGVCYELDGPTRLVLRTGDSVMVLNDKTKLPNPGNHTITKAFGAIWKAIENGAAHVSIDQQGNVNPSAA